MDWLSRLGTVEALSNVLIPFSLLGEGSKLEAALHLKGGSNSPGKSLL